MIIQLELNQKMFHNMLGMHVIKGILNLQSRNVTKKEDKKCIVLKIFKSSYSKNSHFCVTFSEHNCIKNQLW